MYGAKLHLYHSLSQMCNWKCHYCDHPLINNPVHSDLDYLKATIPQLQEVTKNFDIEHCVEGGEIGLIPISILDFFFFKSNFADSYHVATNGAFMEKGLHERYRDKIHSILYHVKPDIMDGSFDFPDYKKHDIDFFYTIVIHRNNIDLVTDFLDYNSDKLFVPHVLQPRREGLNFLDLELYSQIYEIVKDRENVRQGFKERYKFIVENFGKDNLMESRRKICCNNYTKSVINYPTKKLIRCCISMQSDSINLTSQTLNSILTNEDLIYPLWDNTCNDCIAGFIFRDIYYSDSIDDKQDFRKVLKKMAKNG